MSVHVRQTESIETNNKDHSIVVCSIATTS